ncbi:hypothetical protein MMPV_001234 [Pyropia vietnamensis]
MARFNIREMNPVTRTIHFFQRLCTNFGWRFVIILLSAYIGVKGITSQLTYSAYLPYMREYVGVTRPTEYQAFYTVSRLPWSLKATIGMVSDAFPIGGYYKRYYILGAAALGSTSCALLAAAPIRKIGGGVTAAVLLFILTLEHASVDLLVQGVYARKMVAQPETGADLVTAVWVFIMFGNLAASSFVGLFANRHPTIFFWATLPFAAQVLFPVAAGWLSEDPAPRGFQRAKVSANRRFFMLGGLMTVGALGMVPASLFGSPAVQAAYSITISAILCGSCLTLLPKQIGRAQVYMFLTSAMNLQIRGALDVFYTGDEECLPGGPHFDRAFYLAWTAIIGALFGMLGVSLFQMILSKRGYRLAFWSTTVLQVAAAIIDITIIMRWNLRIGISDKLFYVLGDSMLQEVIDMMDFMPAVVLTSKLCPIGVESTVYALLAGFSNFGRSVGSSLGVLALDIARIRTPDTGACNFDNLALLVIISHVVLPLLTVPLTFVLIPNAKMTDDLVGGLPMMTDGEKNVSDGSYADSGGGPLEAPQDVPPMVVPPASSGPLAADGHVPQ